MRYLCCLKTQNYPSILFIYGWILLHLFSNTFRLAIKRYFLIFVNQVIVSLGHQNCIEIVDFRVAKLAIQHSYMSAIFPFLCLLCLIMSAFWNFWNLSGALGKGKELGLCDLPLILTNEMAGFNVTPNKILSGSAIGSISKHSNFKCSDITL